MRWAINLCHMEELEGEFLTSQISRIVVTIPATISRKDRVTKVSSLSLPDEIFPRFSSRFNAITYFWVSQTQIGFNRYEPLSSSTRLSEKSRRVKQKSSSSSSLCMGRLRNMGCRKPSMEKSRDTNSFSNVILGDTRHSNSTPKKGLLWS